MPPTALVEAQHVAHKKVAATEAVFVFVDDGADQQPAAKIVLVFLAQLLAEFLQ
jgi:hypothetical protein